MNIRIFIYGPFPRGEWRIIRFIRTRTSAIISNDQHTLLRLIFNYYTMYFLTVILAIDYNFLL